MPSQKQKKSHQHDLTTAPSSRITLDMPTGAEQLRDWMDRRGFNQRVAAAFFEWDETFISQLINGRRVPGLTNAIIIERKTGIPVEAWVSSEVDKLEPAGTPKRGKRQ